MPEHGAGTRASPFTHDDGQDRRYKWCRCARCNIVRRCTPRFDFYTNLCGPLLCETCFRDSHGLKGITLIVRP